MLERLAAKVINSYVGRYFENINADQLSFGLLQGSVELENLPLKSTALNELDLPVAVIAGNVGKFKLSVPLTQLKSAPWTVSIDRNQTLSIPQTTTLTRLSILLGPKQGFSQKSTSHDSQEKQQALEELEANFRESLKRAGQGQGSHWFSYSTIAANVVNNLQVTITNIHFRYENVNKLENRSFTFGFILEKLEIESTDCDWEPGFSVTQEVSHKLGRLSKLSVYLEHDRPQFSRKEKDIVAYFDKVKSDGNSIFLLNILDCEARFSRHLSTKPLKSKTTPRISLALTINKVPIQISELQLRSLFFIFNEIERFERGKFFNKFRPTVSVKGDPRAWWIYSYKCSLHLLALPISVEKALTNARKIVWYVKTYEDILNEKPISKSSVTKKTAFEAEVDLDIIVKLRGIAFDKCKKLQQSLFTAVPDSVPSSTTASGWYTWWYGNLGAAEASDKLSPELQSNMVNEEEVLSIISDAAADCSLRMMDYLYASVKVTLKSGSIAVLDSSAESDPQKLIQIKFSDLVYESESLPRLHGSRYHVSLMDFTMLNETLNLNKPIMSKRVIPQHLNRGSSKLVSPALSPESSLNINRDAKLFSMYYERVMYKVGAFEHKYRLDTQPLDVVYDQTLLKIISRLAELRFEYSSASKLEKEVVQRYNQLKKHTSSNLKNAVNALIDGASTKNNPDSYNVYLNICAPLVYIYEDVTSPTSQILALDLGKITFFNENAWKEQSEQMLRKEIKPAVQSTVSDDSDDEIFETPPDSPIIETCEFFSQKMEPEEKLESDQRPFKRYSINVTEIQVFSGCVTDNWSQTFLRQQSHLNVLDRFSLNLSLDRCLSPLERLDHPNAVLQGSVSTISLRLSEEKMFSLARCLSQFTKKPKTTDRSDSFSKTSQSSCESSAPEPAALDQQLLLCQFYMSQISVAFHTKHKALAELQVFSLSTSFTKYPRHHKLSFNIRDVVLVDAIQTYGQEFELLFASHHDFSLGGKRKFSANASSPTCPGEDFAKSFDFGSAVNRINLFEKLERSDGLIEFNIVSYSKKHPECAGCPKLVCSVKFSHIDIIANTKTLFELLGYFDGVVSAVSQNSSARKRTLSFSEVSSVSDSDTKLDFIADKINIIFILAANAENTEAHKVAKLTMGPFISSLYSSGSTMKLSASMGQVVLHDLLVDSNPDFRYFMSDTRCKDEKDGSECNSRNNVAEEYNSAISITYCYRRGVRDVFESASFEDSMIADESENSLEINIIAAYCMYDPLFTSKFTSCISEFQTYPQKIKSNLKSAAHSWTTSTERVSEPTEQSSSPDLSVFLFIDSPVVILTDPAFDREALVCFLGATKTLASRDTVHVDLDNFRLELKALPSFLEKPNSRDFIQELVSSVPFLEIAKEVCLRIDICHQELLTCNITAEQEATLSLTKHAYKFIKTVIASTAGIKKNDSQSSVSTKKKPTEKIFFSRRSQNIPERQTMWGQTESESDTSPSADEKPVLFNVEASVGKLKLVLLDYDQCEINNCQVEGFSFTVSRSLLDHTEVRIQHSGISITDLYTKRKTAPQRIFVFEPSRQSVLLEVNFKPHLKPEYKVSFGDISLVLNLQTWIHVFDFFNFGTAAHHSLLNSENSDAVQTASENVRADANAKEIAIFLDFSTINLSVVKSSYAILKLVVDATKLRIESCADFTFLNLQLGKIAVFDETPWGKLYKCKLSIGNSEQNEITIKKFSIPDPNLLRDSDIYVSISTGPITFIHTARFIAEINNFFQYLSKMMLMYQFVNANQSGKTYCPLKHGARIKLDVHFPKVDLVLPYCYDNKKCIIASLEEISAKNDFRLVDENMKEKEKQMPDSHDFCLSDQLHLFLSKVHCYTAAVSSTHPALNAEIVNKILPGPFSLTLCIIRNLDGDSSRLIPDMSISCRVNSIECFLKNEDLMIVKGFLKFNLGEDTSELIWPSDEIYRQRQTVAENLLWKKLHFSLGFENTKFKASSSSGDSLFAELEFTTSLLLVQSYSDGGTKVDLSSNSFVLRDIRYDGDYPLNQRPCVFPEILKSTTVLDFNSPQLQLNFAATTKTKLVSLILSHVKILVNLEWLLTFSQFLLKEPTHQPQKIKTESCEIFSQSRIFTGMFSSSMSPRVLGGLTAFLGSSARPLPTFTQRRPVPSSTATYSFTRKEFKITLNESELVLLEHPSKMDSTAVVLKCSSFISFSPTAQDRVVKFNVRELEVFSCIYQALSDTMLSIIEPLSVEVDVNCVDTGFATAGISLRTVEAELSIPNIVSRLSYQDLVLLCSLYESYMDTFTQSMRKYSENQVSVNLGKLGFLADLGYSQNDCEKALRNCKGDPNKAAIWLVENNSDVAIDSVTDHFDASFMTKQGFNLTSVRGSMDSLTLYLIDDTKSVDLPLIQFKIEEVLSKFNLRQMEVQLSSKLFVNCFNSNLSGWEPLVEPWNFVCSANLNSTSQYDVQLGSTEVLDVTVTSHLTEVCSRAAAIIKSGFGTHSQNVLPSRQPYLPYVINNQTGCVINFATSQNWFGSSTEIPTVSKWKVVEASKSIQFDFISRSDRRNLTCKQIDNILHVQIDGFQKLASVSISSVGTFFRVTLPNSAATRKQVRVIIQVEFSKQLCRRVITIKSGIEIGNCLDVPVIARLISSKSKLEHSILPGESFSLPLNSVFWQIFIRPVLKESIAFPQQPIDWKGVATPGMNADSEIFCKLTDGTMFCYRVHVHSRELVRNPVSVEIAQTSHFIKVYPLMKVKNLLPVAFNVQVSNHEHQGLTQSYFVEPTETRNFNTADLSETIYVRFNLEGFVTQNSLIIEADNVGSGMSSLIKFHDTSQRPLSLEARVTFLPGGGLLVVIYARYWVINKTQLALVFRQSDCDWDAPGQGSDNEVATCATPIMLSFSAGSLRSLVVRAGCSDVRHARLSSDKIHCDWFKPGFATVSLEVPSDRRASFSSRINSASSLYNIAYETVEGTGDYSSTNFIILRPSYMLYNNTKHGLIVKQAGCPDFQFNFFTILPNSCTSFQWDSSVINELLALKLAKVDSFWSGGFGIGQSATFDIYIRSCSSQMPNIILHVDVVQKNGQYLVHFSDNELPPQYIIQNDSLVDLEIRQSTVPNDKRKLYTSRIPAGSSLNYCLDFVLQAPRLLCNIVQSQSVTVDLDDEKESLSIFYETFSIFGFSSNSVENPGLLDCFVLDVLPSGQVAVCPRDVGRNEQIWRLMPNGMIRNEGLSQSFDYESGTDGVVIRGSRVLDVTSTGNPAMVLVRAAEKDRRSQYWRIDSENRLVNNFYGKSIQPVGLSARAIVKLENLNTKENKTVQLKRFQLKQGSGHLKTRMKFVGPTRILHITENYASKENWVVEQEKSLPFVRSLKVHLPEGVGISLVNSIPEELCYISLKNLYFALMRPSPDCIKASVKCAYVQIDNQLLSSLRSTTVVLRSVVNEEKPSPAFNFAIDYRPNKLYPSCKVFHNATFQVANFSLVLVERLLLKVILFLSGDKVVEIKSTDIADFANTQSSTPSTTKLFFQELFISRVSLTLSAHTCKNFSPELLAIKNKYNILLVSFEDAHVQLKCFQRENFIESSEMLVSEIGSHYKRSLDWQAYSILGHVDFLGNPIGLLHDVSSGVKLMSADESPESYSRFARFVTNSVSRSTAKFTGSLSDGIGAWYFDEEHQEERELFREAHSHGVIDNMCGGVLGLFKGLTDGVTGIVTQPIRGFQESGLTGGLTGIIRGGTGTIAKPFIGVLDFAYFAANAMRYSTSGDDGSPIRSRPPRCCSHSKLVTVFSHELAKSQQFLYLLNKADYQEKLISFDLVVINPDALRRLLVTNLRVSLLRSSAPDEANIEFSILVKDIINCYVSKQSGASSVLVIENTSDFIPGEKCRKDIVCDSHEITLKLHHVVNFAISIYKQDTFTFK